MTKKLSRSDTRALKRYMAQRGGGKTDMVSQGSMPPRPKLLAWIIRSMFHRGVPWQ